jgi:hypothetical protein
VKLLLANAGQGQKVVEIKALREEEQGIFARFND